ncbi:MAG: carboxypeptidase-like regulatory domain-containing protein, partial [Gemmatimonadales bacterium]
MTRTRLTALVLLAGAPAPLAAQAVLTGTISDSAKQPLPGVEVVLQKPAARVESNAEGKFTIGNIPWGMQDVVIRKVGYRPVRLRLTVAGNDTVEVAIPMEAAAVELDPIEVTASTVRPGMEDFARRRLTGFGRFFDRKDLERAEHRRLSDFLVGVRGIRVGTRGTRAVLVSSRSGCPMAVWLDGVQLSGPGRRWTQDIN